MTISWTTLYEWYVISCGSKTGNHKEMCSKKTKLRAQTYARHSKLSRVNQKRGTYITT